MHATAQRLAIRLPDGRLLAVPPMRPDLPPPVRVKVYELVLRGQISLAQQTAQDGADDVAAAGRIAHPAEHARVRALLAKLPAQAPRRRRAA